MRSAVVRVVRENTPSSRTPMASHCHLFPPMRRRARSYRGSFTSDRRSPGELWHTCEDAVAPIDPCASPRRAESTAKTVCLLLRRDGRGPSGQWLGGHLKARLSESHDAISSRRIRRDD